MKEFLLLFCLLASSCSSTDIALYHEHINKAEMQIVCGDYKNSIVEYNKAFKYKKFPFAIDLYNKMYAEYYANQYEDMFGTAKLLVENKGIPLATIDKLYTCLKVDTTMWKKFCVWHPQGILKFEKNSSREYVKLFSKIADDDQKYRQTEDRYTKFKNLNDQVDSQNVQIIKNYIEKYGYPTQEDIGVKELSYAPGFIDYLRIPLRHYYQGFDKYEFDLTNMLTTEVMKGNLEPDLLAEFIPFRETFINPKNYVIFDDCVLHKINDTNYEIPIDSIKVSKEDLWRKSIYLESTKELYAKAYFKLNQNPFFLKLSGYVTAHNFSKQEDADFAIFMYNLKPLKKIEYYIDCK